MLLMNKYKITGIIYIHIRRETDRQTETKTKRQRKRLYSAVIKVQSSAREWRSIRIILLLLFRPISETDT